MKWLPSVVSIILAALAAYTPQITDYMAHHPALVAVLGGVGLIINHLLPSPLGSAPAPLTGAGPMSSPR